MNVIFNLPLYARIGLLLTAAVSLWLFLQDDSEPIQRSSEGGRSSDYAMTDFTMTIMDINGVPARQIKGDHLAHYPKGDRTEITNPTAEFLKPGQDTWIITSNKGRTKGKADTILLTGNVIISNKHDPEFNMLTDKLTLNTHLSTAYTEEPVTIHSPQGVTESVGLHAALDEETINLHSRVKGQYDAPPAN